MIAADSKSVKGFPPGPSGSTIAGMRWFGVILRNSGLNWSPAPILIGMILYSRPNSSSAICTLWPLGVGQDQTSSMVIPQELRAARTRVAAILGSLAIRRNGLGSLATPGLSV